MADEGRAFETEFVHEAQDEGVARCAAQVSRRIAFAEAGQVDCDRAHAAGGKRRQVAAKHIRRGAERAAVQQDRWHAVADLKITDVEAVDRDEAVMGPHSDVHHANVSSCILVCSVTGDALPRHELEATSPVRDVGLAVGNLLSLSASRRTEDDHAGAEPVAGVVEKGTRADQDAPGVKVVNELMVQLGQLLPSERELGWRVNDLVVDHPALLTLAHDAFLRRSGHMCNEDNSLHNGSKANSAVLLWRALQLLMARQTYQEPNMNCSISIEPARRVRSSQGLISGLPSIVCFMSQRLNGST